MARDWNRVHLHVCGLAPRVDGMILDPGAESAQQLLLFRVPLKVDNTWKHMCRQEGAVPRALLIRHRRTSPFALAARYLRMVAAARPVELPGVAELASRKALRAASSPGSTPASTADWNRVVMAALRQMSGAAKED